DLSATKRLLIVSDGALQYIPFAALPSPENPNEFTPLVINHEIVNLPSASVLDELRRQETGRKQPAGSVAVLADPVFSKDDARLATHQPIQSPGRSQQHANLQRDRSTLASV